MMRGTTPTHTFELPFDVSSFKTVRVIYSQDDTPVLVKTDGEVKVSGNTINVQLTQDDTFSFSADKRVSIQIRLLAQDGNALASDIMMKSVQECLENEVMV